MSRKPRKISESGYYHVVNRGIGKQLLYEDEKDYRLFLDLLKQKTQEFAISIIAYCLMENHFHLLIYDGRNELSDYMRKIQETYAKYYNRRYFRQGYLFQGRFFSEVISDETHLLEAILYIHNNPLVAGISDNMYYKYSSYREYFGKEEIINRGIINGVIGDISQLKTEECDLKKNINEFECRRRNDEEGIIFIKKILKIKSGSVLQSFDKKERNEALRKLRAFGLSVRQIERLTGISRGVIQNIKL